MIDWKNELKQRLARTEAFAARHPRALTGTVIGLLSGFAVTAFGIAPLAPNASDLPRYTVSEPVAAAADLQDQLSALSTHSLALVRNEVTRGSDTADSLLQRMGAFDPEAASFLRSDPLARRVLQGRAGKLVQLSADPAGRVQGITVRFPAELADQQGSHFSRLSISRQGNGFSAKLETAALTPQVLLGSGTIKSSLFAATDEAGIPDAIASQMADLFSGDIDFHRELRQGDRFSVVFESMTADGEPINWGQAGGRVVAAEFVNNGRSHAAVWYQDAGSKGGYYGLDGQSKRRTFLASPMEFSRVTSGFAMRFHPLLQKWRAHRGIDYGAPTGTAVRTVGDGVVEFSGWQNGFGNVVHVRHAGDRSTIYAHLSRIDVKKGQRIEQGQRIGAVGATGWATGPHLHFEFLVKGQHQDPRIIARASEAVTLPASAKAQFQQTVASLKTQLAVAESIGVGVSGGD